MYYGNMGCQVSKGNFINIFLAKNEQKIQWQTKDPKEWTEWTKYNSCGFGSYVIWACWLKFI